MFERRLKIFLVILGLMVVLLGARAAEIQIGQQAHWQQEARDSMQSFRLIDAARGTIYDCKGRVLAIDQPCTDACVDYRAIEDPPDQAWVAEQGRSRAASEAGGPDAFKNLPAVQKKQLVAESTAAVRSDIKNMWATLAKRGRHTPEQMDDLRQQIVRTVWMRQHLAWYHRYKKAVKDDQQSDRQLTGWRKWFSFFGQQSPRYDEYTDSVIKDAEGPHVILHAVDNDTLNYLTEKQDRFPGLDLRPGTHRFYPYHDVACHILGSLARVDADDLAQDPDADDELRKYEDNDLKGSSGIEALCEPALRGTRGKVEEIHGDEDSTTNAPPIPGHDVRLSIDIELQQQIQSAFSDAQILDNHGRVVDHGVLHGACIVMDVKTGQVRAMVSYPTFDLNTLAENYARLADDDVNQPLLNQATMAEREPGSTMKPLVGLAGIADGVVTVDQGIVCNGYLVIDGHEYTKSYRCWTMSEYGDPGHGINPLTYADALQRSCDVYFETVADGIYKKFGFARLGEWENRFGLGRPTGIGIAEARGRALTTYHVKPMEWAQTMFAATGQGWVAATPLQMADIAATIARNGIWMRPTLLAPNSAGTLPAVRPGAFGNVPEQVDLHLPADALAAAHDGMFRVVNTDAGTGAGLVDGDDLLAGYDIAGKTGTATAAPLRIFARNPDGSQKYDLAGKPIFQYPDPSVPDDPNPAIPWYRGTPKRLKPGEAPQPPDIDHAWYIGYAPAHHPQIAFAVMVEYGGGGGTVAASIARPALEACIIHGYLTRPTEQASAAESEGR
ncbi:MAG TPA: penicillin-binding transpeptidase domain-containing protein [Tepidisphaeraceae bacterium]|nr:penicillin-binding transpeptidase domain-containing protein [Tepidisphaeraceae bacterium]